MYDHPQSRLTQWTVRLVYLQAKPIVGAWARFILWLIGIDIPAGVSIAPGLRLSHPTAGIVVHPSSRIDRDVTLFHGVTLGRSNAWQPEEPLSKPGHIHVCARVVVGAGAVILYRPGDILTVGEGAVIGANSVVTHSIPAGEVWAGNPAVKLTQR